MLLLNLRILSPNLIKHLMKKPIGHFHNVILDKTGHLLAPISPRILKCITHNLLAAWTANQLEALHDIVRLPMLNSRIGVLLILPHDHHIHPRMFRPNIRGVRNAGTDVRIQPKSFASGHIQTLIPPALGSRNRGL